MTQIMTQTIPQLTFSVYTEGFKDWFISNFQVLTDCFTQDAEDLFETIEDFAIEVYLELKIENGKYFPWMEKKN